LINHGFDGVSKKGLIQFLNIKKKPNGKFLALVAIKLKISQHKPREVIELEVDIIPM
jgi:hypothetical protein